MEERRAPTKSGRIQLGRGLNERAKGQIVKEHIRQMREELLGKNRGKPTETTRTLDHILNIVGDPERAEKHFGKKLMTRMDDKLGVYQDYRLNEWKLTHLGEMAKTINAKHHEELFKGKEKERAELLENLNNPEKKEQLISGFVRGFFGIGEAGSYDSIVKDVKKDPNHALRPLFKSLEIID